jgi:hypothetical protein
VALVPHRRENYPNNPPPTRATAISEMGQADACSGSCAATTTHSVRDNAFV